MGRINERPVIGASVHLYDSSTDKQMNGVVTGFDYEEQEIFVSFYEHGEETFTFDEFLGQLNERVNQWQIVR